MQTFLPLPSLKASVQSLDYRRLGKQRVETLQILRALHRGSGGWYNHPAVQMWRGYEVALTVYYNLCIQEWLRRGYTNNLLRCALPPGTKYALPPWFGGKIHASHRAALLFKSARRLYEAGELTPAYERAIIEYDWYRQWDWAEEPEWSDVKLYKEFPYYYWPR